MKRERSGRKRDEKSVAEMLTLGGSRQLAAGDVGHFWCALGKQSIQESGLTLQPGQLRALRQLLEATTQLLAQCDAQTLSDVVIGVDRCPLHGVQVQLQALHEECYRIVASRLSEFSPRQLSLFAKGLAKRLSPLVLRTRFFHGIAHVAHRQLPEHGLTEAIDLLHALAQAGAPSVPLFDDAAHQLIPLLEQADATPAHLARLGWSYATAAVAAPPLLDAIARATRRAPPCRN